MGGQHGDSMDWSEECERFFIELLAEKVKLDPNGAPTFKAIDWSDIDEKIFLKFSLRYGPDRLKAKYHRLKKLHTKFSELLSNTGVTWESDSGKVFANDAVWDDFFKRDKIFHSIKKKGCKIYPLLQVVFGSSTATGAFHNASTSAPKTSEEERILEDEYFQGFGIDKSEADSGSKKRKSEGDVDSVPGMRRAKKNSSKEKMDALMDAFSQSIMARKERDIAKAERYKGRSSEVTSSSIEEYSINQCMTVLESTPDVNTTSYNKALSYFLDANWRKMFLLMSDDRRKAWLDGLI